MEEKNLKAPVFAVETIYNNTAEIPIDVDFTLPDYCPDVNKILKCKAISRIASKLCSGSSITVDGCVTITVIYCSPENRIFSYEYQYPFNKSFDAETNTDGADLCVKTKLEYINCRAVTGRKIDIHGAAGVYVKLKCRKKTDIITDVDDNCIELLRGTAKATSPMGKTEKYLILEDEIELSQGMAAISTVLRYDSSAVVKECKLINNKIMIKGDLILKILYMTENGQSQLINETQPFSQLLELDEVNENCECEGKAYIANIELKPRINAAGEARSFTLNCKILVCCECYCNNDVEVVLDAFSRKFEADISRNEICFNKIRQSINECFSCKKGITAPENDISSVADMWCGVRSESCKFVEGELIINGTVTASFILMNSNGEPIFFEKPIDFEYKKPVNCTESGLHCDPQLSVVSCGYTLTGNGNIELYVELSVNAAVISRENVSLVTGVKIKESIPLQKKERGAMTVYFASSGERIWDIARHYLSSPNEIKQINDIDTDVLKSEKMILVPMN